LINRSPAPGYRNTYSGLQDGSGRYGYGWASAFSSSNTGGLCLGFGTGGLGTNNSDNRASGFQLRCLSE